MDKILVIELESSEVCDIFKSCGYQVTHCQSSDHVMASLHSEDYKMVVIVDRYLAVDKFEVLDSVKSATKQKRVIMISDDERRSSVTEAYQRGFNYVYPYRLVTQDLVNTMYQYTLVRSESAHKDRPKPKFIWNESLHSLFTKAVDESGGHKDAKPSQILTKMETQLKDKKIQVELNKENIKSHLQKYREKKKRGREEGGTSQQQPEISTAHQNPNDTLLQDNTSETVKDYPKRCKENDDKQQRPEDTTRQQNPNDTPREDDNTNSQSETVRIFGKDYPKPCKENDDQDRGH